MEASQSRRARSERVMFETDRQMIVGDLALPPEGYQSRFSDSVNRTDVAFIPLLNVDITPLEGGTAQRHEFVLLSKAHIRLARPVD